MRLKVLIKLSSLIFVLSCAERGPNNMDSTQEENTTTVATQDSSLYTEYDCTSFPRYDWIGDPQKNKAFLKMAITKIHQLNIAGMYHGQDLAKNQCKVSIQTDSNRLNIETQNTSAVELDIQKNYKIQGFSCTDSRIRYDLTYENTTFGTTEYLSLAFSPETQLLKEVFIDTHSIGLNSSRFECGSLKQMSL
ncbi:MAG: hypothetical protein MK008_06150 [Bdellovibrionales bacterium]|nr:hypothetical protein [Bdellovibrionales bacterium]